MTDEILTDGRRLRHDDMMIGGGCKMSLLTAVIRFNDVVYRSYPLCQSFGNTGG